MAILSVTQLNRYVGFKLKEDRALQSVLVRGEITNFTNHYRSGHLYFTLRDAESCVKAVMFRSHAQRLKFLPQEGMNVIAAASAALYERDGAFQIYVTDLQPDGTGGKALALEQLKKKLTAMGVFDAASKRPLPAMPKKIGVITSDTGAALQDVKNVIGRRYPIGHLLVYPAQVQGDAAADLRAPTPSAAAELAVPDVRQMLQQVQDCSRRLENAMQQQFRQKAQELERLQDRLKLQSPAHRQELAQQELCHLQKRLEAGIRQIWQQCQEQLVQQTNRLDMLSPMKILGRGYALAYHGEELVRSAAQVQSGDVLRVQLAEGEITAKVQ